MENELVLLSKPEDRVLTFKEATEVITLDELRLAESDQQASKAHYEFIDEVRLICDRAGIKYSIDEVYVNKYVSAGNKGAIQLKKQSELYGENNIRTWLLRRALTLVKFTDYVLNDMGYTMALNYLQDGFQVALGMNVHICKNMCIYGGNIVQTYGEGRRGNISYDALMDHIRGWVGTLREKYDADMKVIDMMKSRPFNHTIAHEYFGGLMENAMIGNKNGKHFMFDETEVKDFQRGYLEKIEYDPDKAYHLMPSLWDFYNCGTSVLRMNETDTRKILVSNNRFSNSILEEFGGEEIVTLLN